MTPSPAPTPTPVGEVVRSRVFATTHWSVVLSAQDSQCPDAAKALERLCTTYWYPLYVYLRRLGHSPHDAEDLTQGFFQRLVEKGFLRSASPERGRFRNFLLVALKRYRANEWDRSRAEKRGGGQVLISLDTRLAEEKYQAEPAGVTAADHLFDRRWAFTMLERALRRLRQEWETTGKGREFEALKIYLRPGDTEAGSRAMTGELDLSEGALRVAVHRLRRRFREIVREEIADTVQDPRDVESELHHLLEVLRG